MVLSVIGHGYVGLVTASVFADLGNTVWVIGRNREKIEKLQKGSVPFYEPGLEEVVQRTVKAGHLKFTFDYQEAIAQSEVVFIAVGTTSKDSGEADLSSVFAVAKKLARYLSSYTIVATKSTVPPGTNRILKSIIEKASGKATFDIASTPEFLSQGTALQNTLHPDRVVIGTEREKAKNVILKLHKPMDGEVVLTNLETAEMIKYAANAMLSTRISFANTIALLCERVGADGLKVLEGVGLDKRIGRAFLSPGIGFGGSCLPKDAKALMRIGEEVDFPLNLLKAVSQVNKLVKDDFVRKAKELLGGSFKNKTVGVLGLAFKPNTDDMRDAPAIYIIEALGKGGAKIQAYDPAAMENARRILPHVKFLKNPYEVCKNSDILVLLTEWNEFKELDLIRVRSLLKRPIILDGRNIYERGKVEKLGFTYQGVGA